MRILLSILFLLTLVTPTESLKAQNDSIYWRDNAILRSGELEITFKMRDYKYYAALNHPKLVQMMGGVQAFAKTLEEEMIKIETEIKIDSMDFGTPFNFMKCDSALNCLLPQTMILRLNDTMALRSTVYLLGTSEDGGKTWYFVDGSNGATFLDAIVPVRCKLLAIPNREQEFLTIKK